MDKRFKEELKLNAIKAIFLLLVLILISNTYSLFSSSGVELDVEKGYILEKNNIIFSKNPPPGSDFIKGYKLRVLSREFQGKITIKTKFEGSVERILSKNQNKLNYSIKGNEIYIFLDLNKQESVDIFLIGPSSINIPSILEGYIYPKEINEEKNESIIEGYKEEKPEKEKKEEVIVKKTEKELDEFSIIVLVLSIIFLVVSSLLIASLTPKPKKRKPISPGEIIFKEEY